jgi:hypothetical protein
MAKMTKLVGANAKVSKHKSTASQVLPKNRDFYFSRIKVVLGNKWSDRSRTHRPHPV